MDKEDLKKYTCINLRCVTQSSKEGVPLNQLQNDYRQLLGTTIPFKELGYSSLEHFLLDIPDVICLKKKKDGSVIVEGVADASTAHIAKLISKQKSSKKSKSAKPTVVTRTLGNCVKKNSHQNLKSLQTNFNISPPNTSDIKHEQMLKCMQLSPAQQELKKSVLINLRSVVQSCKDGVPLNRLQNDYRRFIGSNIPFENLGYSTLFEFIKSIPDVIELKEGLNEQLIAIGVVDAATAHLFGDSLKPKPLKSLTEQCKSSVNNIAALQISSEQKTELPPFFKIPQNVLELSDISNVIKYSAPGMRVRQKSNLENFISGHLLEVTEKHPPTEELQKSNKPLKVAQPAIDSEIKSVSGSSLTRDHIISLLNQNKAINSSHQNLPSSANIVSTINHGAKLCSSVSASGDTVENGKPLSSCSSSTSESIIQQVYAPLIEPEKRFNLMSSKSSDQDESLKGLNSSVLYKDDMKSSNKKKPVNLNSKEAEEKAKQRAEARAKRKLEKAQRAYNHLKSTNWSRLAWMYFVLYVPSNVQTLRNELESFHGFPFSKDSAEWKQKEDFLLQVLPKTALKHCLNHLGIEFINKKCSKKSLQNKLMDFLASNTLKSGTNTQETMQESKEKELYDSTLTLSSVSSDILPKCSSNCDTENSDALLSDKNVEAPKCNISDSESDYTVKMNLMTESSYYLQKDNESIETHQLNNKGNLLIQKPSTEKVKPVSESQQPLNKHFEQKVNVEECSKTETSSIVNSKNDKGKKRRRRVKEAKIADMNNGTNIQETVEEDKEKELYDSTLTLSSVSSDILPKCSSNCDTENSDAMLSDKNVDAPKIKCKISDSDNTDKPIVVRKCRYFLRKYKDSFPAEQLQELNFEDCSETETSIIIPNWVYEMAGKRKRGKARKPKITMKNK